MLRQLGPGGPRQQDLAAALVREMGEFAAARPEGFTLIFDDYHVVDRCEETEPIVRALLERTGPGFSLVIAGRTTPRLPLGRLRARGGVSRLDGDALCFDVPEADRLFRDAYHQPLDPDVVTSLIDRTEGWPALLSLVHTNLDEGGIRDPRALVRGLTSTEGDLYDYLAEEVIETLPTDLREFLTRVSLLDSVVTYQASIMDGRSEAEITPLIRQAEELGLLARPDSGSPHRFHPLVRDFLRARLADVVGVDGIIRLHRCLAERLEESDWYSAASHYLQAGDVDAVERIVDASLEEILASGRTNAVHGLIDGTVGDPDRVVALVLRSRVELGRGNLRRAVSLASSAASAAHGTAYAGVTLLNLATVVGVSGFPDEAMRSASEALSQTLSPAQHAVAVATVSMWEAGHEGDLTVIADALGDLARRQDRDGHLRYASITRLNLASLLYWIGEPGHSLALSIQAEAGLRECGAPDIELGAALAAKATATAWLAHAREAVELLDEAATSHSVLARDEAAIEAAKICTDLGDLTEAAAWLDRVGPTTLDGGLVGAWALVSGQLALRRGDYEAASESLAQLRQTPCRDVAGALRGQLLAARLAIATGGPKARVEVEHLATVARSQRTRVGMLLADILMSISAGGELGAPISQVVPVETPVLSMLSEEISGNLHLLTDDARSLVESEARKRPDRWASALRLALRRSPPARVRAAEVLAQIGSREDAALLRHISGSSKAVKPIAVALMRRLAPAVLVSDLGSVEVTVGGLPLARALRRRVLALLCYLVSRPNLAATKDEVLDALWPELGPETAGNSLHQTIYFLRRVFEPEYREGYSAGYVVFDGEVVRLEEQLIDSSSRRCWRLLTDARRSGQDIVDELLTAYTGRFALDFAYEEWASDYRDTLHAAVLGSVELAVNKSMERGDHDRAIDLAHSVLSLDPTADSIELTLLRAYKAGGRPAAAAEQYAHYSSVLRDQLGIEPPPFGDL
jgi:DNA-binding SARP family transcriptional activator